MTSAADWATAFLAAVCLSLVATPLVRRLAVSTGFLDQPAEHKAHARPVPYLGGVAIVLGSLGGTFLGSRLVPRLAVVVLAAAVVAVTGLVDDRRHVHPFFRLGVQTVAAIAVLVAGIRIDATDIVVVDSVATLIWIVGITNALNLLDNMDGLASGVATVVAAAVFAMAALGDQAVVAGFAAALSGACVGFVAYNVRPAAIFMGDAGSLFLGFLLSIATLVIEPSLTPPMSFVVPVLLLGVALLDTATVVIGRLRQRRPVMLGNRDHLSHRLVARGIGPAAAVAVLIGVQAALGAIAILAGRGVLSMTWALAGGLVLTAGLAAVTWTAPVYATRPTGLPRWVLVAAGAAIAAMIALAAPAALALLKARPGLEAAAEHAERGIEAARAGDRAVARTSFARAEQQFEDASANLDRPLVSAGLAVPVLASNLRAARTLSAVGARLSTAGLDLADELDPARLRVQGGRLDVQEVKRVTPALKRGATALRASQDEVASIDTDLLLPAVANAISQLSERLTPAVRDAERAAAAARIGPGLLGADGARRYFLAVQNTAELRATGGFIGNFGEIVADEGQVTLDRFGRIDELNGGAAKTLVGPDEYRRRYGGFDVASTWQNVNLSPDLPTVAEVIAGLYPQSGGRKIDGVIAVDPAGLAALLELTGPVRVAGWPEPLTAENVIDVTLSEAYHRFATNERVEFLGQAAAQIWQRFVTTDLPEPKVTGEVLGRAVREKHLLLSSVHDDERTVLSELGVAGALRNPRSDSLAIVTQNAGGNKVDYYLRRAVRADIRVEPEGDRARVTTRLSITLTNDAPSSGAPHTVIGPFRPEFAPGENRMLLSVFTPLHYDAARLDGDPVRMQPGQELGREVVTTYLSIGPGDSRTIELDLSGFVRLGPGRRYELDFLRQPTIRPDDVDVSITAAEGWGFEAVDGLASGGPQEVAGAFALRQDHTVALTVDRFGRGLWERLRAGR